MPRRPRRTILKLTRWSVDEWRHVEEAARPHGLAPLRYVREATLEKAGGAPPPEPSRQRPETDELVHQLARVLSNLRQLLGWAELDWDDDAAALLGALINAADAATVAAPSRRKEAAAVLAALVPAGVALNEVAHRANADEALPPYEEVHAVLTTLYAALRPCLA
jgi:hypothetical protein